MLSGAKNVAGTFQQESHAVAGKPRDAAVNSDRYQQPVGQKQSEWETENIT